MIVPFVDSVSGTPVYINPEYRGGHAPRSDRPRPGQHRQAPGR